MNKFDYFYIKELYKIFYNGQVIVDGDRVTIASERRLLSFSPFSGNNSKITRIIQEILNI